MRALILPVAFLLAGCPDPASDAGRDTLSPDLGLADGALEEDAGAADAASVDGALDAAPADAAPPPTPCVIIEDLPSAEGVLFEGITGDVDAVAGTCGGGGAEATFRFVAPSAGTWLFAAGDLSPGYRPVLHLREACADADTERACGASRVATALAAGEVVFVFVDADNRRGGFFRLEASRVPARAIDEACDPERSADACPADAFCRPVEEGGICTVDTPPEVDPPTVFRHPAGRLSVEFTGRDASRDATVAALQLYAHGERLILDPVRGFDTWLLRPGPPVTGLAEFEFRFRAALLEDHPEADHVRLQMRDGQGNQSPWRLHPLGDAPIRAPLAPCDPRGFADACPDGTACRFEAKAFRCGWLGAPRLDVARVWRAPAGIGVRARGVDPDGDRLDVRVVLLGEGEETLAEYTGRLRALVRYGGRIRGAASWRDEAPPDVARAAVSLVDPSGRESASVEVAVEEAPTRARGEACDVRGGLDVCGEGDTCAGEVPVCAPLEAACPEGWPVIELSGAGPTWHHLGDSGEAPDRGARGSCAGGAGQVIYRFTPSAAGRYRVMSWSADRADTVLSVRTHCGLPGTTHPQLELACNDDSGGPGSSVRVTLEAEVPVFIVVDGYRGGDAEGWRGPYILRVEAL